MPENNTPRPDVPSSFPVRRWKRGNWENPDETSNEEERVHILWEQGHCVLWAWPRRLEELALGHVLLDCLGDAASDVPVLPRRRGSVVVVNARPGGHALRVRTESPSDDATPGPSVHAAVAPDTLLTSMDAFMSAPGMWDGTGCFHRAAMLHLPTGKLAALAEDISRHNCLDRLAGYGVLQGMDPAEYALLLSARITGSLYAKARRAGFSTLISRAAVTSAAWRRAIEQGVTLVGFCRPREHRLTVFADERGRICP